MQTKEEILKQFNIRPMPMTDIKLEMDEWTKQQAIDFAKWLLTEVVISDEWYYWIHLKDSNEITSEQLYELFQQRSKQK